MPEPIWPMEAVTHTWDKHRTTAAVAVEALNDSRRGGVYPDPKSRSGKSNRFIGFSPTAGRVLVVIVVDHDGGQYGANCWPASPTDQRIYREEGTPSEHRTQ